MSSWFQAQQGNFDPRDSRSIGWSQVPNRKALFFDEPNRGMQTSTGGGTILDLSNNLTFGTPKTDVSINPTINYAQFSFENPQNTTVNHLTQQTNLYQSLTEISNLVAYGYETALLCEDFDAGGRCNLCSKLSGCGVCTPEDFQPGGSCDVCETITENCDLCAELSNCASGNFEIRTVIENVYFDDPICGPGLCFKFAEVQFNNYGMIASWETLPNCGCIPTTECPA